MTYYYLEVSENLINKIKEQKDGGILGSIPNILNIWGVGKLPSNGNEKSVIFYPYSEDIKTIANILAITLKNDILNNGVVDDGNIVEDIKYGKTLEIPVSLKGVLNVVKKVSYNSIHSLFYALLEKFIKNEGVLKQEIENFISFTNVILPSDLVESVKSVLENPNEKSLYSFKTRYISEFVFGLKPADIINFILENVKITVFQGREITIKISFKDKEEYTPVILTIKTDKIDKYLESRADEKKKTKHYLDSIQVAKILGYIYKDKIRPEDLTTLANNILDDFEIKLLEKINEQILNRKVEPFESRAMKELFYDFLNMLRTDERIVVVNADNIDIRNLTTEELDNTFAFYFPNKNRIYVNAKELYTSIQYYRRLLRFLELNDILIGKLVFRKVEIKDLSREESRYKFLIIDLEKIKEFVPEDFYQNLIKELKESNTYAPIEEEKKRIEETYKKVGEKLKEEKQEKQEEEW